MRESTVLERNTISFEIIMKQQHINFNKSSRVHNKIIGDKNKKELEQKGCDRYFTKFAVLQHIAEICKVHLKQEDYFVDFSCGANEFAPLLGCEFLAMDVIVPSNESNFEQRDWFTVVDIKEGCIIGLNPPFGYQGQLAKKFVEHALNFKPRLMFLILPNVRWSPKGYEGIYQEELPNDSYYDPNSNKVFKEISTNFHIFARSTSPMNAPAMHLTAPEDIMLTRKWLPNQYPFLVVRRVGRNAGKQFYCVAAKDQISYVEKGFVQPEVSWKKTHNNHAVESEYFLKVYFQNGVSLENMLELTLLMCENPEDGWDRRQPHAITNQYVIQMIYRWLEQLDL